MRVSQEGVARVRRSRKIEIRKRGKGTAVGIDPGRLINRRKRKPGAILLDLRRHCDCSVGLIIGAITKTRFRRFQLEFLILERRDYRRDSTRRQCRESGYSHSGNSSALSEMLHVP